MACVKDNGAAGCSTQMKAVRRPAAAVVISIVARAIAKIAKHIAKSDVGQFSDQYRVLFFEVVFGKFGIMGWIRIELALLNTFANCDLYIFEILTFRY